MKNKLLALFLLVAISLLSFCSCDLFNGNVDLFGEFTVVVENSDGTYDVFETNLEMVMNKKEGTKGVIEHLNQRNDSFYLEMVDSTYGAYVSAIGSIKEDNSAQTYVIIYTSLESDSYPGAPTLEYEGKTLYQSGVGLSGMSAKANGVVLFRLEKLPY